MVKDIQLRLTLKDEERSDILLIKAAQYLSIPKADITGIKVLRKSIDARKPKIILNYKLSVYIKEALPEKDIVFSPLVKQEEKLKEKKEQMQELYNLGIQALKELRGNCKILPRGLIDKFDLIKVSAI